MRKIVFLTVISCFAAGAEPVHTLRLDTPAWPGYLFKGVLADRIQANMDGWLLRAPAANPGMLDMFRRRDRHLPYDRLVPWAGEFAGKYLIAAVQARRISVDPRLEPHIESFVRELIATQAEDGYLGPFTKDRRLLGEWDLWGHYHVMLGLLMWHEDTSDKEAFQAVLRAADLIARVYGEGGRRPIEAGAPECNFGVLHVLGRLYRITREARYMDVMRRIEEDMAQAGNWLELGARGVPWHKLPNNGIRWESLHAVQGFVELYRITGDEKYRTATLQLWESLRDYERHPSGAFSTNEGATGSPYREGSIETCCSVAWLELTTDVLRLTGDVRVADELELTTLNQVLAAQHPSGSWCTYDTPINGVRKPAYHHINFQYRPGAPELNCCSVNAPRGLGSIADWAVMVDDDGPVVNLYAPGAATLTMRNGTKLTLLQETAYPVEGGIRITVQPGAPDKFSLRLRIPAWTAAASLTVDGAAVEPPPAPGTYASIDRLWKGGEIIELGIDLTQRVWLGQEAREGRGALYAGPLLLAFDTYHNDIEMAAVPAMNLGAVVLEKMPVDSEARPGYLPPLALWRAKHAAGEVILCDFASAGAHGTEYAAWLPDKAAIPLEPAEGAAGAPGPVLFRWASPNPTAGEIALQVARVPDFSELAAERRGLQTRYAVLLHECVEPGAYYWRLELPGSGFTGARQFTIDTAANVPLFSGMDARGRLLAAPLDGSSAPLVGTVDAEQGVTPAVNRKGQPASAVALAAGGRLAYAIPFFPERGCAFTAWVRLDDDTAPGLQQICSSWYAWGMDPMRVVAHQGKIYARIEYRGFFGTDGVPLEKGVWTHVAAVRDGPELTLYLNGERRAAAQVPEHIFADSRALGVGCNPRYGDPERFHGALDDAAFYAAPLSAEDVRALYEANAAS